MFERNGGRCGLIARTGALALGVVSASGFASAETREPRSVSACAPTTLTMSSWVPPTHHLTSVVLRGFADEVEQAWIWADDILRGFADRRTDVHFYAAGTWGPAWADAFIERDGRHWRKFESDPAQEHLLDSNARPTPILQTSA